MCEWTRVVVVVIAKREEKENEVLNFSFGATVPEQKWVGRWEEKLLIHHFHDQHPHPSSEPNDQIASRPYLNPTTKTTTIIAELSATPA